MDKAIKEKWVKALRSGRYKQAKECLYNGGGYCCLGVLARVQGAKTNELGDEYLEDDLKKYAAGLRLDSQKVLARMNDGSGNDYSKTFKEIADYIEKRY